jgi:hypothetical protein
MGASVLIPKFGGFGLGRCRKRCEAKAPDARQDIVCGFGPHEGLGLAFTVFMQALMAASSSVVDRWTPRRSCFPVRLAKKR